MDDEFAEMEKAVLRLVESEAIIPLDLKSKIENATNGHPLPSLEDWKLFFNTEAQKIFNINSNLVGYKISEKNIEDFNKCLFYAEVIPYETIKKKIGWGLLSESGVLEICKSLKEKNSEGLLEIGCGSGYWASVLKSRLSIDVQACEKNLRNDTPKPKYTTCLDLSAQEAMEAFPEYDILMIWPDTNDVGVDVLNLMKPGQKLFISGSIEVTGSKDFYERLDKEFDICSHKTSISFSGAEERLYCLEKRQIPKSDVECEGGLFRTIKSEDLFKFSKIKKSIKKI